MKGGRFRYALEPVLLTRLWDRDALLAELGKANGAVAEQTKKLAALENDMAAATTDWKRNAQASGGLTVDRFRIVNLYLHDLAARCEAEKRILAELEHERDALAERLSRSQKAVEAVESHKDEMRVAFRKGHAAMALKESDDHWSLLQQHTGNI